MGELFGISCLHASFFTKLVVLSLSTLHICGFFSFSALTVSGHFSFFVCYSATKTGISDPTCIAIYGHYSFFLYSAHGNFGLVGSLLRCGKCASKASGSEDVAAEAASVT